MSGRAVRRQDGPFVRNEASDARDQRGDGVIFSLKHVHFPHPQNPEKFMNAVRAI